MTHATRPSLESLETALEDVREHSASAREDVLAAEVYALRVDLAVRARACERLAAELAAERAYVARYDSDTLHMSRVLAQRLADVERHLEWIRAAHPLGGCRVGDCDLCAVLYEKDEP